MLGLGGLMTLSLGANRSAGALGPEAFGAVADEPSAATANALALQEWIDSCVGRWGRVAPGAVYWTDKALFVRRDGTRIDAGTGADAATFKLTASTDVKGSVITFANCSNWTWLGGIADANDNYQNGFTVIGRTSEFAEATEYQAAQRCTNFVLRGQKSINCRFHINNRQGVQLRTSSPTPSGTFQVGEIVDALDDNGRPMTGVVVQHDTVASPPVLYADWDNRIGSTGTIVGRTSGATAGPNTTRVNVDMVEAISGSSFASWFGKFGGKALSIQRATDGGTLTEWSAEDCDNGLTLEAAGPGGGEGAFERGVTNMTIQGEMHRIARAPVWVSNATNASYDSQLLNAVLDLDVVDPCSSNAKFGIVNGDRAHDITGTIDVSFTGGYVASDLGFPAVMGGWGMGTDLTINIVDAPKMFRAIDSSDHNRWGNAPGSFASAQGDADFDISLSVTTATGPLIFLRSGVNAMPASTFTIAHDGWNADAQLNSTDATINLVLTDVDAGTSYTGPADTTTPVYS